MMQYNKQIVNLPNMVSMVRILMAPVLFYLAFTDREVLYLLGLVFTGFTDVLDGFLARWLDQITEMGSRLDSWGDFTIYTTMAICAWIIWPDILVEVAPYCLAMVLSFTLPVLIGLIKFKSITSYHTWSVKLAVLLTYIGYILLFSGIDQYLFMLASVICVLAAIEEIGITFLIRDPEVDVRSIWMVMKKP